MQGWFERVSTLLLLLLCGPVMETLKIRGQEKQETGRVRLEVVVVEGGMEEEVEG